jgi:predicted GNAT family acetyltransferase
MHTLHAYRGQGVGRLLVEDAIQVAKDLDCKYFRVSAERTAVGFYAKCGIPFLGMQKSGTFLSLFNIEGPRSVIDEYIHDKALKRLGRVCVIRSAAPNQKEQAVIDALGTEYLYDQLINWAPPAPVTTP